MTDAFTHDLPPSTRPTPLSVTIGGLDDPEKGVEFANLLGGYLHALGSAFDISRLDAVTATNSYVEALAAVDRGFETTSVVTRSENEDMVGVAMCVHVLRDGVPKAHLVCDIEMLLPLWGCEQGSPEHAQALQLLAHECAHIEDLKREDEAYPGVILQQKHEDEMDAMFMPIGAALWHEYYACRRAAHFDPSATSAFAMSLASCLDNNQSAVDDAIRRYRVHADINKLVAETLDPATRALRVAAYLFGHLDGLDQGWDAVPEIRERLDKHGLNEIMNDMVEELQRLWSTRYDWTSIREMNQLCDLAWDAYAEAGVIAQATPEGGLYLDVPFTAATL